MPDKKSIDQLTQDVLESGIGVLSDKDLESLFGDAGTPSSPVTTTPVTPPPAPDGAGIQDTKQGDPGTPAIVEPDVLSQIPEKYRDKDVPTSLGKIAKSIADAEAALSQKDKDIQQLRELVESLKQPVAAPAPTAPATPAAEADPDEDIDDTMIIEKPKENIRKIAERAAARMMVLGLTQYDTLSKRERTIEKFRDGHADFDALRPEMAQVVKEFPQLNQDPNALGKIYDLAKNRVAKRNAELAGIGTTPAGAAPVNVDEIVAKAVEKTKLEILEGIKKRRAASGISTGSPATGVDSRTTITPKTVPQTEEDKLFEDILDSGPSKLDLG